MGSLNEKLDAERARKRVEDQEFEDSKSAG